MVSDVQWANLIIEIVLSNYVERVEASVRRLNDYLSKQHVRAALAETVEEGNDLFWPIVNLIPRYEWL